MKYNLSQDALVGTNKFATVKLHEPKNSEPNSHRFLREKNDINTTIAIKRLAPKDNNNKVKRRDRLVEHFCNACY